MLHNLKLLHSGFPFVGRSRFVVSSDLPGGLAAYVPVPGFSRPAYVTLPLTTTADGRITGLRVSVYVPGTAPRTVDFILDTNAAFAEARLGFGTGDTPVVYVANTRTALRTAAAAPHMDIRVAAVYGPLLDPVYLWDDPETPASLQELINFAEISLRGTVLLTEAPDEVIPLLSLFRNPLETGRFRVRDPHQHFRDRVMSLCLASRAGDVVSVFDNSRGLPDWALRTAMEVASKLEYHDMLGALRLISEDTP